VAAKAFELVLGKPLAQALAPSTPAEWDGFVGTYVDPNLFGRIVVTREADKLFASFSPPGSMLPARAELVPAFANAFLFTPPSSALPPPDDAGYWGLFEPGPNGVAPYFVSPLAVAGRIE
jgi:hypothetical protein